MTTEVSDDTSSTDLAGYFGRIGYTVRRSRRSRCCTRWSPPTTGAIPFENLDPLTAFPVADLGAAALIDKLVHRRRGGYCYEQNGLMAYVLEELGYGVERLAGRVVWMNDRRATAARPDASGAVGDGARRRRTVARRRRVRRADPVVADPARGRPRATDPARAVPAARAR